MDTSLCNDGTAARKHLKHATEHTVNECAAEHRVNKLWAWVVNRPYIYIFVWFIHRRIKHIQLLLKSHT